MQAKLIYCDLPRPLASVALGDEPVRIGRAPSCQLRVSDFSVADEHCAVHREGGRWVVEALDVARASNIFGRTAATAAMVELSAPEADPYDFLVAALLSGFSDPSPGKAVDDIDQTLDVRDSALLGASPLVE
jgi:hypothetical protein